MIQGTTGQYVATVSGRVGEHIRDERRCIGTSCDFFM